VKNNKKEEEVKKKDKQKKDEVETQVVNAGKDMPSNPQLAKSDTGQPPLNVNEKEKKEEPQGNERMNSGKETSTGNDGHGYFKTSFDQQVKVSPPVKTETVTAGIFRMAGAPKEDKYYLLIDGVQSGTIVKIINPGNNRMVYAKVLGEMSGIRQNQGLDIRISNTAASTLSISDTDKFIVKINY
jgi:hypothetical protein